MRPSPFHFCFASVMSGMCIDRENLRTEIDTPVPDSQFQRTEIMTLWMFVSVYLRVCVCVPLQTAQADNMFYSAIASSINS